MLQNRSSESNCGHFCKLQLTQTNFQRRVLKRIPKPWVTEPQRRRQCKAQLQTQELKLDQKSYAWNRPLVCHFYKRNHDQPRVPQHVKSTAPLVYDECLEMVFHKPLQSHALGQQKGYWVGSQSTWILGLALLQLNLLTLGKSLQVSVPVSSSVKCWGRGRFAVDDLSKAQTTGFSMRSSCWWRVNTQYSSFMVHLFISF